MLPTLAGSAVFSIVATASAAGTLKSVAGVVADEYDPTPSNNTAVATVTVTAAPAPSISSVNPTIGYTAGGTFVTIYGFNFKSGATVSFGGTAATAVTFVSAGQLNVTTPAHAAGTVNVVVINPDSQPGTLPSGFKYQPPPAPSVLAVNPNTGPTTGGTAVTISGTNFLSGAAVTFGGTAATGISVVNATTINATTPARGAYGPVDVVVTTSSGTGTLLSGFTYRLPTPTITTILPVSGSTTGGTSVTINGGNFALSGRTVKFGASLASNVVVGGAGTTITATTPIGSIGRANVVVTVPDGQTATLPNGFMYLGPAPTVTGVNPSFGPVAGGQTVTITGTNFRSGATVQVGSSPATGVNVAGATSITALTPAGSLGSVNVVVTNQDDGQSATFTSGFTYVGPPSVTSIDKAAGPLAGGQAVTITGSGFRSGATVRFGAATATVGTVTSSTIIATTPAGVAGTVSVFVTNVDGQVGPLFNAYTYRPAPTVTAVIPNAGWANAATPVTISGSNFVSAATVLFGSTPATGVSVLNATTISATSPALPAGTVNVTVTNPEGQSGTLPSGFTYSPAPTITAVSPSSGSTYGGATVTIVGSNFVATPTVTFGGIAAPSVTWNSTSQITAITPARVAGFADVVVRNPDQQSATRASGFYFDPAATRFYTVTPCRVIDTRNATGPLGGPILQPGATRDFTVTGTCGIPFTARSISVNIAVVPNGAGALRLYPAGITPPGTSSINFNAGVIRANNGIFMLSSDGLGRLSVTNLSDSTNDFILDVNGYFQ